MTRCSGHALKAPAVCPDVAFWHLADIAVHSPMSAIGGKATSTGSRSTSELSQLRLICSSSRVVAEGAKLQNNFSSCSRAYSRETRRNISGIALPTFSAGPSQVLSFLALPGSASARNGSHGTSAFPSKADIDRRSPTSALCHKRTNVPQQMASSQMRHGFRRRRN